MTPTFELSADNPRHRQALAYLVRLASIDQKGDERLETYRAALSQFKQYHEQQFRNEEGST